ncbi:MAG: ChbG/HpnK family deacetylase [Candidatus Omnitrophota bacterium]|jgi:radical SAM superfamily enzyme YgiQ (UPF0313 family)/predicted glycoside hydrolase/deacetylase ChbG (UPF0249 family)
MYATSSKKIVFVNPPLAMARRYGLLWQAGGSEPPLGLCYLAGAVRQKGFDTAIIDAQAAGLDMKGTIKAVMAHRPAYIGITAATMAIKSSYELAREIKKAGHGTKVIIGGCHVSSLPEDTLKNCDFLDAGVIGEGEDTIVELIRALDSGSDLGMVRGVVSRHDGDIRVSPARNRIKDLDSLPYPAFDLLPEIKKFYRLPSQSLSGGRGFSLVSSRGCFGRCLFCDKTVFGDQITMHSAGYITEMIAGLKRNYGITDIMFEDDNFMVSRKRLEDFSGLLKKRRLNIRWSALARIDSVDEGSLRAARSCGCWQVSYGIESGCQRILDLYEKNISANQIKNTIAFTKKAGLKIKCFFMWGNPCEDKRSLRDTAGFIKSLAIDDISISFFTPYYGSRIWKDIGSYGVLDGDTEKMSCFEPVFRPFGVTYDDLVSTRKKALRDFYLRPAIIFSYLRRINSMNAFKRLLSSAAGLLSYTLQSDENKSRYLIINADDFGLTKGINRGIIEAFRKGVVTSASLLPVGRHFSEAISLAKGNPRLDIGIHLCLTEEKPVLEKEDIPSLVRKDGYFLKSHRDFIFHYILGRIKSDDIEKELEAQISKVLKSGLSLTHMDSHGYIHMLPGILAITIKLAKKYNIKTIRYPKERMDGLAAWGRFPGFWFLNVLCFMAGRDPDFSSFIKTDRYFGFLNSGHLSIPSARRVLRGFKSGIAEFVCHPGEYDKEAGPYGRWKYDWEGELKALISLEMKEIISSANIRPISFRDTQ